MSYRVEKAVSGRAVCKGTECKNGGVKIPKDDLRLGVWVDYRDSAGWSWRHWGCVSGKQLQNIRDKLMISEDPLEFDWDALDGYDGDDKGCLAKDPDLQEKVRRVITQGFIDAEDWNGDPEMNKLGETGTRTAEHRKQIMAEERTRKKEIEGLKEQLATAQAHIEAGKATDKNNEVNALQEQIDQKSSPAKKPAAKKRDRRVDENGNTEDEGEGPTPAKKKRVTKAKKEEDGEDVKPPPKKRAKKAKKEETDDEEMEDVEDFNPAPKKRVTKAKKTKKEETDDEEMPDFKETEFAPKKEKAASDDDMEDIKPAPKKARGKKAAAIKSEASPEPVKQEVDDQDEPVTAPKKRAPRAKKAAAVKDEPVDEDVKPAPKKGRGKKAAVKKEEDVSTEGEPSNLNDETTGNTTFSMKAEEDVKHEPVEESVNLGAGVKEEEDVKDEVKEDPAEIDEAPAAETKKKGAKGKGKKIAAAAQTTNRGSRSRTASKATS